MMKKFIFGIIGVIISILLFVLGVQLIIYTEPIQATTDLLPFRGDLPRGISPSRTQQVKHLFLEIGIVMILVAGILFIISLFLVRYEYQKTNNELLDLQIIDSY